MQCADLLAFDWPATNAMGDPRTIPIDDESLSDGLCGQLMRSNLVLYSQALSNILGKGEPISLLFWLSGLRDTIAIDPRDKVYGALGLTESFGQNE